MAKLIEFVTVAEIAARLGVTRQRVHAIAASRQIEPVRRVGRVRLFAASDWRRFAAKKKSGRPRKLLTGVNPAA